MERVPCEEGCPVCGGSVTLVMSGVNLKWAECVACKIHHKIFGFLVWRVDVGV
jgi:hypothetical protein